jgi:GxxExxY protein
MNENDLTKKIIGCAYKVHNILGPGFLEKVYENALRIELERLGMRVKQQEPINVSYEGQVVGEYYADLWIDECLVVEVKAVQTLVKQHEVQLVNYLAATNIDSGLLLNFGPSGPSETQVPRIQTEGIALELYPVNLVNPVYSPLPFKRDPSLESNKPIAQPYYSPRPG